MPKGRAALQASSDLLHQPQLTISLVYFAVAVYLNYMFDAHVTAIKSRNASTFNLGRFSANKGT
jgi:hypothetical protein